MIKIIEGNLLDATEDIIGHQVNCCSVMGSGIAKSLSDRYSILYPSYRQFCQKHNPHDLLGKCHIIKTEKDKYIANIFGQLNYGRQKIRYTDYDALEKALMSLKIRAKNNNLSVSLPWMIGCGLANGDWNVVYKMIDEVFEDYEVTLYKLK